MEVSSQTNNYQAMNSYQKPVEPTPLPIVAPKDESFNEDVYSASQGNLINNKDGEIVLTPQGETNLASVQDEKALEESEASQEQKDNQRAVATGVLAHQSKQSQVEIYLAVATDGKVSLGQDDTASIIESLRDVQKQNNAVEAYAAYQENQKGGEAVLY